MRLSRNPHPRGAGFALLEVTVALILLAGITLYLLQQQQRQAALDKASAFAADYVTMSKAAEQYVRTYKIALQKLSGRCQSAWPIFFHGPAGTVALQRQFDLDCRLRNPETYMPVAGADGKFIGDAFHLSVNDLIQLGFLPSSFASSGRVLPTNNRVSERVCANPITGDFEFTTDRCDAAPIVASPGPFLQIQMRCNNVLLTQFGDHLHALCSSGVQFRTLVYSKQPLPQNLSQLNLTRAEVLFKAAEVAGSGAVMSLDNNLAPGNGTDGLLYNATRSYSVQNPILDAYAFDGLTTTNSRSAEGIFAVYADHPQPSAVKETPFAACNPGRDFLAFPSTAVSRTVHPSSTESVTFTATTTGHLLICSRPGLGFCDGGAGTFCWMPRATLSTAASNGWASPGYPVASYDYMVGPDSQPP